MRSSSTETGDVRGSRRRHAWALAVLVLLGIVLLLVAAEAAVRIRMHLRYGSATASEDYLTIDPAIGLRVPKKSFASGHIRTNSMGFRGPEIATPKPPGVVRIAFLGASTTWCAEVSSNELVWPALVTDALRQRFPESKFDYVNAGVVGYTLASILKNLEFRVAPLQPDVIVFYEAANNLSGELRDIAAARGIIADAQVREFSWPGRYSMLWYLVEKNLAVLASQREAQSQRNRLDIDTSTIGGEYGTTLRQIIVTGQRTAKLVAVATFSTQLRRTQTEDEQLRAAASALFYMPFATPRLVMDGFDRYNQIARELAHRTGALLIEGEYDIPGDALHFTDTVHFTDAGSRAMAQRISSALIASPRFLDLLARLGGPKSDR